MLIGLNTSGLADEQKCGAGAGRSVDRVCEWDGFGGGRTTKSNPPSWTQSLDPGPHGPALDISVARVREVPWGH